MTRVGLVAMGVGLGLIALDAALAPVMVQSEVVASLLSPGGLTAGRAALALGYVAVRLFAVFLGPALIVGGAAALGLGAPALRAGGPPAGSR